MLYFVYKPSITTGGNTLMAVSEPTKNAKGLYKVSSKKISIPGSNVGTFNSFTSVSGFVIPYVKNGLLGKDHLVDDFYVDEIHTSDNKYLINNKYTTKFIESKVGKWEARKVGKWEAIQLTKEATAIKKFVNNYIDMRDIRYLDPAAKSINAEFAYFEHKKGQWKVTKVVKYKYHRKNITEKFELTNSSSSFSRIGKKEIANYSYASQQDEYYEVSLTTKRVKLAPANTWELGAIGNIDNADYCFYCTDISDYSTLAYYGKPPLVQKSNEKKLHSCKSHGGTPKTNKANSGGTSNTSESKLTYNYDTSIKGGEYSIAQTIGRLQLGSTGEYKDGVAPTPYVMIELRSTENPDSDDFYNLSIPANSFVSLTHERNLQDGYNTFTLQLFDKDAMQVESKLLLGFRSITFYYTDFVSTSKRFRGEILNYKTVITGKGLMLTLEGYTSNAKIYTNKDSIPWSLFFEIQDYEFMYWLNAAGEYHGVVKALPSGGNKTVVNWMCDSSVYADENQMKYTSTDGYPIAASLLRNNNKKFYNWLLDGKSCEYSLRVSYEEGGTQTSRFDTFDVFYNGTDKDKIEKYKPHPTLFSLKKYNSQLEYDLRTVYVNLGQAFEMRPSHVVRIICMINGWKVKSESDIVETQTVTSIPDQISSSYIEYIEKKLVPISISESGNCTQYAFWFDDEGYAHYSPLEDKGAKKSLYFNSVERKDSYPLIAFTSATNGAILMQVNASQQISAINVYTGDELDYSTVERKSGKDGKGNVYSSTLHRSEEWYATNTKIIQGTDADLLSYKNKSIVSSEEDLKKELSYRYGLVSKYTYKASLDVYGCADITPGDTIKVYIYIDDGERTNDVLSKDMGQDLDITRRYKGNVTMHHTSGTYFVNKITDSISGGRYISSLEVLKIDTGILSEMVGNIPEPEEEKVETGGEVITADPNSLGLQQLLKH